MLADRKSNLLHFMNMLESCAKLKLYAAGFKDAEMFFLADDQLHYNGSLLLLLNIGESASKLSPEIAQLYPECPWKDVHRMRNRVAHDYPGLDVTIVFNTIKDDIPVLEHSLYEIVKSEEAAGIFDPEEWGAARTSEFYRLVDFSRLDRST
jgi:uncharacterized protein with HEPN domain